MLRCTKGASALPPPPGSQRRFGACFSGARAREDRSPPPSKMRELDRCQLEFRPIEPVLHLPEGRLEIRLKRPATAQHYLAGSSLPHFGSGRCREIASAELAHLHERLRLGPACASPEEVA